MPSEKKHRSKSKDTEMKEPLKPLEYYVKDRVQLTRQLFSNLKSKQIKNRLPPNLRNKSMERIQQICLDEILGISTKRILSIINDTVCPDNTDSSSDDNDSDLEIMSLEEISSDSEAEKKVKIEPKSTSEKNKKIKEKSKDKVKEKPKEKSSESEKGKNEKPKEKQKENPKNAREMTMLELLELQARARAIRSQLALEPVQKIELSDDENQEQIATNECEDVLKETTEDHLTKEKGSDIIGKDNLNKPEKSISAKDIEEDALVVKLPSIPPGPPSKPVKIKRNYRGQLVIPEKPVVQQMKHEEEDEESDSSDIITIDPNLETYFISDSGDEDEIPAKKSPEKLAKEKESLVIEAEKSVEETPTPPEPEDGEVVSGPNSPQNVTIDEDYQVHEENSADPENAGKIISNEVEDSNDIVNLTSDTEIDTNPTAENEEKVDDKQNSPLQIDYDDSDVVDIHGEEAELMDEIDKETTLSKSDPNNQTWEDRWLSSSKNQKVLKTTKIASKVRGNVLKTKRFERETAKTLGKKKEEKEKEFRDKIHEAEEGSMDQFKKLKENA